MVNGLARERDGMVTVTVRPGAAAPAWLDVRDPETGAAVPALAEGVRRQPDGSLAEVTLTFRARGVPPLGYRRYPLAARPGRPRRAAAAGLDGRRRRQRSRTSSSP